MVCYVMIVACKPCKKNYKREKTIFYDTIWLDLKYIISDMNRPIDIVKLNRIYNEKLRSIYLKSLVESSYWVIEH